MKIIKLISRTKHLLIFVLVLLTFFNITMPSTYAISLEALKSIINYTPFYGEDSGSTNITNNCNNSANEPILSGNDNPQKGFNFFVGKGLSDIQSAAIIGNFMQESSMRPDADQANGPGLGIAQWSNPGRWNNLESFATKNGNMRPKSLGTQLAFSWAELTNVAPAGDYSKSLTALKGQNDIDGAVNSFEINYEAAKDTQMQNRINYAKRILEKYGTGTAAPDTTTVSGVAASCGSSGSINCENITTSTSLLSKTRQNVVCLTQVELMKWDTGALKPGTDFMTNYSLGRDENWCADFASFIFNKAGYPLDNTKNGNVPAVDSVVDIGKRGDKFIYHQANGYIPIPGDIVIYKLGISHLNIVVSVNQNDSSMDVVGGNQNGATAANSSSKVNKYTVTGFDENSRTHVTGYVSPRE